MLLGELVRADSAGAHRADRHAVAGELIVQHLNETDERPLARAIRTLKPSGLARDQPDVSAELREPLGDPQPDTPRRPSDDHRS
ncbi:MAG: hypothetical protein ACLP22_17510 [Solirubrobacteraceae bacterium]